MRSGKAAGAEQSSDQEHSRKKLQVVEARMPLADAFVGSGSSDGDEEEVAARGCPACLWYLTFLNTGGMITAAVDLLKDRGAKITQIRIIVVAPPALKKLHMKFPGFIVPGLGDVGDHSYGT
ncbi:hypothetical protein GUJ93_ZPchr0012g22020 [Zizania palustris]|uniref:Uracil phosphoribosyltransferase n=1 Tax=Zizania palustris TaxID=103762 RepID=A0A8J5WPY9_ZIZPA|nr:hypothetical protein GUJ93_ZPchr0012g22020 [Zizania palustris]